MPSTFTLEDLAQAEKPFRSVQPVAAETPPVVPESTESPAEDVPNGDVVDTAEPTPAAAADDSAPAGASEPGKGSARERIEELVADKNALKKYIEYRESLWGQPAATPKVETPVATPEVAPTLESCQFDTDKWTQAMNAWTQKQIQTGIKQALSTEKQTASVETQKAQFEERMESFAKATPDAKVVLGNPALPQLSPEAAALVVASDIGPQILYYLGKNPEKAARIARQSPIQQAEAIGRISAEVKVTKSPQRQISNAPTPPTPTRGAAAPIDEQGGTIEDFVKRERAKLAARRQRH